MNKEFVKRFDAKREDLMKRFAEDHMLGWGELVRAVIEAVTFGGPAEYGEPDPERIHAIDDGNYQGALVFVIGAKGYQPSRYWFVKISYGSCSGCDAIQAAYDADEKERADGYMRLALGVLQGLKELEGGEAE